MEKIFAVGLTVLLATTFFTKQTYALTASPSATPTKIPLVRDTRVQILKEYFEQYDSPLADSAATFIQAADENQLDWKLVAAISGVESTFGHHIPYNSYNAWGWGVYGDNVIRFASFDDAVVTISKGLRTNYYNKGAETVYDVGRIYAASPTWAQRVSFFMEKIDKFSKNNLSQSLSLTI